jgi:hypothetical protein
MRKIDHLVYDIKSKPFGITYSRWTIRWWRWLLSIPKPMNPAIDDTGEKSWEGQVYRQALFLCQTIENSDSIPKRNLTITSGKGVLMPIINWISIEGEDGNSNYDLRKKAKEKMDVIQKLEVSINNFNFKKDLERFRIMTAVFEVYLPENNILDVPKGIRRAISDGYWLFFKPLCDPVDIRSFGTCSSGATKIAVNYHVEIVHT